MAVIFFKIKAKSTGVAVATASIFNAEIEKRNHISLSSLSGRFTILVIVNAFVGHMTGLELFEPEEYYWTL